MGSNPIGVTIVYHSQDAVAPGFFASLKARSDKHQKSERMILLLFASMLALGALIGFVGAGGAGVTIAC